MIFITYSITSVVVKLSYISAPKTYDYAQNLRLRHNFKFSVASSPVLNTTFDFLWSSESLLQKYFFKSQHEQIQECSRP